MRRHRIRLSDTLLAATCVCGAVLAGVMLTYVGYVVWMAVLNL